jgi:hypothetical protein
MPISYWQPNSLPGIRQNTVQWLNYMHFRTFILELCMLVLMISCSSIFWCLYRQLKIEYNYYFSVILLDFQSGIHGHSDFCASFSYVLCAWLTMIRLYRSADTTNQRIYFDIEPCGKHLATGGQVSVPFSHLSYILSQRTQKPDFFFLKKICLFL